MTMPRVNEAELDSVDREAREPLDWTGALARQFTVLELWAVAVRAARLGR